MLPAILGKSIYSRSAKIPIPVNIASKQSDAAAFKREIGKALAATYFNPSPADCHAVKIGTRTMAAEKIAENIDAAMKRLVEKYIPKGWEGLKGLHIKAAETVALPIWLTEKIYDPREDVLTVEEVKAIEFGKTPEGLKERKEKKKEDQKEKKRKWEEKKKTLRHWDSDVEEDEEPAKAIEGAPKTAGPGVKRKAEQEIPVSSTEMSKAQISNIELPVVTKKQKTSKTESLPTSEVIDTTVTTVKKVTKVKSKSKGEIETPQTIAATVEKTTKVVTPRKGVEETPVKKAKSKKVKAL